MYRTAIVHVLLRHARAHKVHMSLRKNISP